MRSRDQLDLDRHDLVASRLTKHSIKTCLLMTVPAIIITLLAQPASRRLLTGRDQFAQTLTPG